MTTTCLLVWAAVLLLFPLIFLAWLTESDRQRARRWRQGGATQQAIANRLGCTRYRVRQLLA